MTGFYLMHRGWMDSPVFANEPYSTAQAWEWLIHEASFESHKIKYHYRIIEVLRGELPSSYRRLAEKFKWGINRVRKVLKLFESQGMISLKTDTGFIIITICNYEEYQVVNKKTDTGVDTHLDTQVDTGVDTNIKKGKELKEGKRKKRVSAFALERIPEDWINFSIQEKNWDTEICQDVFRAFREYYTQGRGKKTKREDWGLSWRTWVRRENIKPKNYNGVNYGNHAKTKYDRTLDAFRSAISERERGYSQQD
jgi:DNA-binding transcriptional regulator YhcF (GntR family)